MMLKTIEWVPDSEDQLWPGKIRMIDQTKLPEALVYLDLVEVEDLWEAIKVLRVRGAPAIGVAAAMGVVLGAQKAAEEERSKAVEETADYLATSRPTARNLFWALDRMKKAGSEADGDLMGRLVQEAIDICREDEEQCRAIGRHGLSLLVDGQSILTHCNAGSLATARYGTALAPIYLAHEKGMKIKVWADETRPLLQGARLTAWELAQADIDVTLICDNMAGQVMKEGRIDAVFVGSDRIAANGDAANKIGTYSVAVLAHAHDIPFYVLAPSTTFDLTILHGDDIPIEQRDSAEISRGFGKQTAPEDISFYTPAFDVTPASLITAIVCEKGIARPPFRQSIKTLLASS